MFDLFYLLLLIFWVEDLLKKILAILILVSLISQPLIANTERSFKIWVDVKLSQTGLLDFLLPRFSLKNNTKVEIVSKRTDSDLALGVSNSEPIFAMNFDKYGVLTINENHSAVFFIEWMRSGVVETAVAAFNALNGTTFLHISRDVQRVEIVFEGNATLGAKLAKQHCGRCHKVGQSESEFGIGSTPSFRALRALKDWDERMMSFYVRNPHPAFMRVEGISEEFDEERPATISPIELSIEDTEALQSYVSGLEPANLGEEVVYQ
ncbi:MAG: hypothetical protein ABR89_08400 [Rhodobacter sp. BACL10 MAG-120910-bin24]|nr:MAG: hypothetical protein ABR89_08400 [Rhodobacter sp. BACL10 MAG-120910-bin24]